MKVNIMFYIILLPIIIMLIGCKPVSNDKYYNYNNIDMTNYTKEYVNYMFKTLDIDERESSKNIESLIKQYLTDHEVIRMGVIPLDQSENFKNNWRGHTLLNPIIHGKILQDWKQGKSLYYTLIEVDETFMVVLKINNVILITY